MRVFHAQKTIIFGYGFTSDKKPNSPPPSSPHCFRVTSLWQKFLNWIRLRFGCEKNSIVGTQVNKKNKVFRNVTKNNNLVFHRRLRSINFFDVMTLFGFSFFFLGHISSLSLKCVSSGYDSFLSYRRRLQTEEAGVCAINFFELLFYRKGENLRSVVPWTFLRQIRRK